MEDFLVYLSRSKGVPVFHSPTPQLPKTPPQPVLPTRYYLTICLGISPELGLFNFYRFTGFGLDASSKTSGHALSLKVKLTHHQL